MLKWLKKYKTQVKKVLAALTFEHQYTLKYYLFINNEKYMIMHSIEYYKDTEH